jgi:cytochrome c554/c'-like protein
MSRRLGIAVLGAALAALLAFRCATGGLSARVLDSTPARADKPPVAQSPTYVGARSCAAAGCHNGNDLAHPAGSEYSIWSAHDPHARAFTVLSAKTSEDILKALGESDDKKCLACHSLPAAPAAVQAEGVSCEACHGPASDWLDDHYTKAWRDRSADEKEKQGFFPTRDLARRTDRCADCHVGRPGAEVDHDLIAAGHPRLAFEYAAYHELLPRHWKETGYGTDFAARAWEIGQVAAAQRAKDLAASHRAGPEFADLDCFACHHDLRQPSWRQERPAGGKPGMPEPSAWYTTGVTFLKAGGLDPAVKPSDDLGDWAKRLQASAEEAGRGSETVNAESIKALLLRLTKPAAEGDGPASWDQAAQTYLAVGALSQALADMGQAPASLRPEAVKQLRETLRFPAAKDEFFNSPRGFDPRRFRDALQPIRSAFSP